MGTLESHNDADMKRIQGSIQFTKFTAAVKKGHLPTTNRNQLTVEPRYFELG